jgi:hypothetical protein
MEPYEIICSPFEVYLAPVGTTFPDVDAAPSATWKRLGANGNKNHADGVKVAHGQTLAMHTPEGCTAPVKATRTAESLIVSLTLWDLTAAMVSHALNELSVTDTNAASGTPGYQTVNLRQGITVQDMALLVRGVSPYDESMNMQYEVPRVVQSGNPEPVFTKANPAALALAFSALEDPAAATDGERLGRLREMDAIAL